MLYGVTAVLSESLQEMSMDLPTRTKQKKAESESYAILLYKLRHLGIFRNLTESDYGIDFEIELVSDGSVTGLESSGQISRKHKRPQIRRNTDCRRHKRHRQ